MRVIVFKMPDSMAEIVDDIVKQGLYSNRSELIRDAIRRLIRDLAMEGRYTPRGSGVR